MKKWSEEELIKAGYMIQNAKIINVDLSTENYCCCDFPITLDGDGWGVVYGAMLLEKVAQHTRLMKLKVQKWE